MAEATITAGAAAATEHGRRWVVLYLASTGLVLLLMMLAGLLLRLAQAGWLGRIEQ